MFKNLVIRTISGAVYVSLVVASILIDSPLLFGALFLLFLLLGLREFFSLAEKLPDVNVSRALPMVGAAAFFLAVWMVCTSNADSVADSVTSLSSLSLEALCFVLGFLSIPLIFILELFRQKGNPILNIAVSVVGFFYVLIPIASMAGVIFVNPILLLAFFVIIWASDTGAYLTGMCFGKHKMFVRVSPKKTWEGLFGGLVFALVVAYIFSRFNPDLGSLPSWAIFSVLVFVTGTLGDLVESLFKRTLGVKDSGAIMPGHGGILDRLDSALLAAPVALLASLYLFR